MFRRNGFLILVASIVSSLVLGSAQASAPQVLSPAASPQTGFSGFNVGIGFGVVHSDYNEDFETTFGVGPVDHVHTYEHDFSKNVFSGEAFVGYNWQFSHFIIGPVFQADFFHNYQDLSNTVSAFDNANTPPRRRFTHHATVSLKTGVSLGLKFGWLIAPSTLVAIDAGAAWSRAHYSGDALFEQFNNTNSGYITFSRDKTVSGYRLGFELSQKLSNDLALGLAYIYTNYGSLIVPESSDVFTGNVEGVVNRNKVTFETQTMLARLTYFLNPKPVSGQASTLSGLGGFYVGLFGGYRQLTSKIDSNNFLDYNPGVNPADGPGQIESSMTLTGHSGVSGLELGYGHVINNLFYLALGLDSTFGIETEKQDTYLHDNSFSELRDFYYKVSHRDYLGIALKPGILLSPATALYINTGIMVSRFKVRMDGDIMNYIRNFEVDVSASHAYTKVGYRIGVGIIHRVAPNLLLRFEETYTIYPAIDFGQYVNTIPLGGVGPANFTAGVRPSMNEVSMGLDYTFH